MGKLLLVGRLAVRDIRHRPAQAALLLIAIAAGAMTLTLGLGLAGTTNQPYARTRTATRGPDVVAAVFPRLNPATLPVPSSGSTIPGSKIALEPADVSELVSLESAPGVNAHSGPFPVTWTSLRTRGVTASAEVEGRGSAPSSVDQPRLVQGTWIRSGGVVVEAGFASALGLQVGDRLSLGATPFEVVGIAVTAAAPTYPNVCKFACIASGRLGSFSDTGLLWVTETDVEHLAARDSLPIAYQENLQLQDPADAVAFSNHYDAGATAGVVLLRAPRLIAWQTIRSDDNAAIANVQLTLFTGSWLLALMALASVAVLVGGRMATQSRRVGLLKAIGSTPFLIAVILLLENVLVSLCGAAVGLVVGWLTMPLLDASGASLLGAPSAASLSGSTVGVVVAVALAVACVATSVPAIRAARQTTVAALGDSARAPRRRAWVVALSAHLPAPLLVGARLAARRPRRLMLNLFSVAVATSGLVAVLVLHSTSRQFLTPNLLSATTIVSVMLVVLAAVNAVFIAWAMVVDARHSAALTRALGATPEQITTGLCGAQLLPCVIGALLGIPGGVGIYAIATSGGKVILPSPLSLVAMVAITLLAVGVLTAIPGWIGSRRPPGEVLQSETA